MSYRRANSVRTEPHARHAATTTRRFSGSASARAATRQRLRRRIGQQVTSFERAHSGRPNSLSRSLRPLVSFYIGRSTPPVPPSHPELTPLRYIIFFFFGSLQVWVVKATPHACFLFVFTCVFHHPIRFYSTAPPLLDDEMTVYPTMIAPIRRLIRRWSRLYRLVWSCW